MTGFYLMRRGWMDHPALQGQRLEPFSRREAWCWLMEHAAYEPVAVKISGKLVQLQRGQLSHSFRFLAEAWQWPLGRVMRFVSMLIRCRSIDTASDTGQTIISICNYEEYQAPRGTADTLIGTPSNHHRIKDKEVNELTTPLSPPSEGGRFRKGRGVRRASPAADQQPTEAERGEAIERARRLWWGRPPDWWRQFDPGQQAKTRRWVDRGEWRGRGGPPGSPGCNIDDELAAAAVAERAQRLADQPEPPVAVVVPVAPTADPPLRVNGAVSWDDLAKIATVRKAKRPKPPNPRQREMPLPFSGGKAATGTAASTTATGPPADQPAIRVARNR